MFWNSIQLMFYSFGIKYTNVSEQWLLYSLKIHISNICLGCNHCSNFLIFIFRKQLSSITISNYCNSQCKRGSLTILHPSLTQCVPPKPHGANWPWLWTIDLPAGRGPRTPGHDFTDRMDPALAWGTVRVPWGSVCVPWGHLKWSF